jgi:hypothetical protein
MKTKRVKNDPQHISRFNRELERRLRGHREEEELSLEDQQVLDLAESLARMDLSPSQATRERLRWRLISQVHDLRRAADTRPQIEKLHLAASRIALVFLVVLVGLVFSNLAYLTGSKEPSNATAYATDRIIGASLGNGYDVEDQSLQIAPKIVPTPIAPPTIVASAVLPIQYISTSSTGSTGWSPTLMPIETP